MRNSFVKQGFKVVSLKWLCRGREIIIKASPNFRDPIPGCHF